MSDDCMLHAAYKHVYADKASGRSEGSGDTTSSKLECRTHSGQDMELKVRQLLAVFLGYSRRCLKSRPSTLPCLPDLNIRKAYR